MPILD